MNRICLFLAACFLVLSSVGTEASQGHLGSKASLHGKAKTIKAGAAICTNKVSHAVIVLGGRLGLKFYNDILYYVSNELSDAAREGDAELTTTFTSKNDYSCDVTYMVRTSMLDLKCSPLYKGTHREATAKIASSAGCQTVYRYGGDWSKNQGPFMKNTPEGGGGGNAPTVQGNPTSPSYYPSTPDVIYQVPGLPNQGVPVWNPR